MSGKAAPYALTGEEAVDSENLPAYSEVDIILRRPHDGTLSFEIETDHPAPHARWYHAALHSMCAVVGAGVLGLPYSIAHLGWVGGLTCLTLLTSFSIYTSWLLSALHERAVPGRRLNTYHDLGEATLGSRLAHLLVTPLQQTLLVGLCITYTVTAGQSLKGLIFHDCVGTACQVGTAPWIALFGVLQLCLSAIPDFHSLRWVSLLGSAMSVGYASIAAYGVIAAAVSNSRGGGGEGVQLLEQSWPGDGLGRMLQDQLAAAAPSPAAAAWHPPPAPPAPAGRPPSSTADVVFGVFNALGGIGFAFGGQAVLPEIQATLADPRPGGSTLAPMMGGIAGAYVVVILAYYIIGVGGYAAWGQDVAGNVLMNLQGAKALRGIANIMVLIHVAAAYQLFAQPVFALMERAVRRRAAERRWRPASEGWEAVRHEGGGAVDFEVSVSNGHASSAQVPGPSAPPRRGPSPGLVRALVRGGYVFSCTLVALLLPFFSELMGIIASIGLVPVTFVLPPAFWLASQAPGRASKAFALVVMGSCTVVALLSLIGSTRNIVQLLVQPDAVQEVGEMT